MANTSKVFKEDMREFNKSVKGRATTTELIKELVGLALSKESGVYITFHENYKMVFRMRMMKIAGMIEIIDMIIIKDACSAPSQLQAAIDKVKAL